MTRKKKRRKRKRTMITEEEDPTEKMINVLALEIAMTEEDAHGTENVIIGFVVLNATDDRLRMMMLILNMILRNMS